MGRKPQSTLFCRKCKALRPRADFPIWKMGRLRPAHYCKRHLRPEVPEGSAWCPDCRSFRPLSEFWGKTRRNAYCRLHAKDHAKRWYRDNIDAVRSYRTREDNRAKHAARERERRKRPDLKQKEQERTIRRRAEFREYARRPAIRRVRTQKTLERYHTDIAYRLRCRVSHSIRAALNGYKGQRTFGKSGILPYTVEALKLHLERQFLDGMSWDNYGPVWHIDHILPVSSFEITGPGCPELLAAFALTNLRPLWAIDNVSKHARRLHLI